MKLDVRRAEPGDLGLIVALCAEHAQFERSTLRAPDPCCLGEALFGPASRLDAWVAAQADEAVGFATASPCYSTWAADEYYHLDCLFLRPAARGRGIGRQLLRAVAKHALQRGFSRMEWQTPDWNRPAIRFYEALGARGVVKQRFSLALNEAEYLSHP